MAGQSECIIESLASGNYVQVLKAADELESCLDTLAANSNDWAALLGTLPKCFATRQYRRVEKSLSADPNRLVKLAELLKLAELCGRLAGALATIYRHIGAEALMPRTARVRLRRSARNWQPSG